jgi:hypothetical protein
MTNCPYAMAGTLFFWDFVRGQALQTKLSSAKNYLLSQRFEWTIINKKTANPGMLRKIMEINNIMVSS